MKEISQRIYAFDLLKFFLCIVIATFHFSWKYAPQGYLAVEIFFVISGFLMYYHKDKYIESNIVKVIMTRISGYYLYYVIFLFFSFVFIIRPINFSDILNSMLFLQFLGIGNKVISNILWFLGCYTYIYILYIILLKKYSTNLFNILPFLLIFFMVHMYTISPNKSIMWTYEKDYYIFGLPFCVLRSIVSMGIGLCFGTIANRYPIKIRFSYLYELFLLVMIFYIFFCNVGAAYDYLISLMAGVLCYLLHCDNVTNHYRKPNNSLMLICKLSLPVYIFHPFILDILNKKASNENWYIYITLVLLFSTFMQMMTYIITKIFIKFYKGRVRCAK